MVGQWTNIYQYRGALPTGHAALLLGSMYLFVTMGATHVQRESCEEGCEGATVNLFSN